MRLVVVVLMVSTACAPRSDAYTPRIEVEPHAEGRICHVCLATRGRDAGSCPAEVERVCAEMCSDLIRAPIITFTE